MISTSSQMLAHARESGTAILAVTSYSLEATSAIISVAERSGTPMIIQVGASSYRAVNRAAAVGAAVAAATAASVEIGVHLDHCTDMGEIAWAVESGYSSVMFDGSSLPWDANVSGTRRCASLGHQRGVWVEGELGALAGDEDVSTGDGPAAGMTDPAEAEQFVVRTGVDALAVAVGNVHGIPTKPVRLDLDRLGRIAARVAVPLVLHGSSGLTEDELRAAVSLGVAKVNVNAEVRQAWMTALTGASARAGDDVRQVQESAIRAMSSVIESKVRLLSDHSYA